MSDAPNYTPTTSFATDESNSVAGRSTVKTVSLDTELANASSSINALNTNLKKIQRDDGKVKDGVIEPYALSTQTRALLAATGTARGNWTQNTNYLLGESVQYSATAYICLTNHNSGSIFTDALWMAISDDGTGAAVAAAAAASAAAADISEENALSSANTATAQAVISTAQAVISTTQATNSANSAAAAASVISDSIAGSSQAEAEAGANNTKFMSSLRVKQAITALFPTLFPSVYAPTTISKNDTSVTVIDTASANDRIEHKVDGVVLSEERTGSRRSTIDGGSTLYPEFKCRAWVNYDETVAGTYAGGASTVSRSAGSTTATVTTTNPHGHITGNVVSALTGVAAGVYTVTVTGANTYTFTTVATTLLSSVAITFAVFNIRASGNVSSVSDDGTGEGTVNFSTALPDANYSVMGFARQAGATFFCNPFLTGAGATAVDPTTAAFKLQTRNYSPTLADAAYVMASVFR